MPTKARAADAGAPETENAAGSAPAPIAGAPLRRAIVWMAPAQAGLIAEIARLAGLTIVGAGSSRGGLPRPVVEALGGAPFHDLRHALHTTDADLALFASGDAPDAALLDDADLARSCAERRVRLLTLEPAPSSLASISRPARGEGMTPAGAGPVFLPLLRRSPGMEAAIAALETFGHVTTLACSGLCGGGQGTLAARVFDAMDFVSSILGMPEAIDASVRGPRSESGLRLAPGESLRDLRGDLTAHMRFADGRACSALLSDRAGKWSREATLIGEGGRIRIDDEGLEWVGPGGEVVDSTRQVGAEAPDAAPAIAREILRLLDPRSAETRPVDTRTVLAMAEAAVLSARTGQPESPETILRMARSA